MVSCVRLNLEGFGSYKTYIHYTPYCVYDFMFPVSLSFDSRNCVHDARLLLILLFFPPNLDAFF